MFLCGRGSKNSLELTYSVIVLLESYLKAKEKLQALTYWQRVDSPYAIAL